MPIIYCASQMNTGHSWSNHFYLRPLLFRDTLIYRIGHNHHEYYFHAASLRVYIYVRENNIRDTQVREK